MSGAMPEGLPALKDERALLLDERRLLTVELQARDSNILDVEAMLVEGTAEVRASQKRADDLRSRIKKIDFELQKAGKGEEYIPDISRRLSGKEEEVPWEYIPDPGMGMEEPVRKRKRSKSEEETALQNLEESAKWESFIREKADMSLRFFAEEKTGEGVKKHLALAVEFERYKIVMETRVNALETKLDEHVADNYRHWDEHSGPKISSSVREAWQAEASKQRK
jgi:hypothetical protein